jgi:hypothetical protein
VAGLLRFFPRYAVGLVVGLIILPGACSAAVVALTLSADQSLTPGQHFFIGTAVGIGAWLVLAIPLRRMACPRYANSGVYRELASRHRELSRLAGSVDPQADRDAWEVLQAALESAKSSLEEDGCGGDGSSWAGGAAYVVVFTFIHRAEQALTKLVPQPEVVQQALFERASLMGSHIANAQEHVYRLERAIHALGGADYLPERRTGSAPADPVLARGIIQDAQAVVDDFRDTRRRGLVRSRNRLFATVVFAGVVSYAGLGLALLAGAGQPQVIAGATFYLIGASVGLFRQLGQAATASTVTEEDYGLGMVRLVHTPLASGLAAIGGVVLTAYATVLNSSLYGEAEVSVPSLSEVFTITDNPLGLLAAAVFGFAPSLLASSLQSRAEKWKEELKSSAPAEKTDQA